MTLKSGKKVSKIHRGGVRRNSSNGVGEAQRRTKIHVLVCDANAIVRRPVHGLCKQNPSKVNPSMDT